jgi:phosphatidylserine decarboxylase
MSVRCEILPFLFAALGLSAVVYLLVRRLARGSWRPAIRAGGGLFIVLVVYLLVFFRDPVRTPPSDPLAVVAGAEGRIAKVTELNDEAFVKVAGFCGLKGDDLASFLGKGGVTRISIFLSLIDVHVNRSPIAGKSSFLGYFPGTHIPTYKEKSSDYNQHNSILIRGASTPCLVNQIVGPVARRVVYWPPHDRAVDLPIGAKIGMMKFGSRLDMYLPKAAVELVAKEGDRVRAGETVVARLSQEASR